MSTIAAIVGKKIRSVRNSLGYSIELSAEKAGISPTFLANIEHGHKEPSLTTLKKLSCAFGIQLVDLVAPVDSPVSSVSKHEVISHLQRILSEQYTEEEAESLYSFVATLGVNISSQL